MLIKIISLFFIFIAILALIGRLRLPGRRKTDRLTARKCPKCGTFRIGPGPCPCEKQR